MVTLSALQNIVYSFYLLSVLIIIKCFSVLLILCYNVIHSNQVVYIL